MPFTEAKNEFDSKYQFIKEYTCFLPDNSPLKFCGLRIFRP